MRDFRSLRSRPSYGFAAMVLCGIVGAFWTLQALAQSQPPIPSATARRTSPSPAPTDSRPRTALADEKSADLRFKGSNRYIDRTHTLKGELFIYKEEDTTITGDNGAYNRKTKILDADGHLVFDDPTHHATADRAHIDDDAQTAEFQSNVILVLKPHPSASTDTATGAKDDNPNDLKQHGATVTCDKLHDQYAEDKKLVKMYGHLIFKQSYKDSDGEVVERTLTAEHAEYDGKTEHMVLFPPVAGQDNKGEKYDNDQPVTICTKEGEEAMETVGGHYVFYPDRKSSKSGPSSPNTGQSGSGTEPSKGAKTEGKSGGDNKTPPVQR